MINISKHNKYLENTKKLCEQLDSLINDSNLGDKELINRKIQEMKIELQKIEPKKYGLIWEEKVEDVDIELNTKYPFLKEIKEKEIKNSKDDITHILIEGDNLHSLNTLMYTHQSKVDLIIIDPPYNTKNKDFIYNDKFVGEDDEYRHSKWLSFMKPRLELSKELLKNEGFIFINIDDNEFAQLKLLCDKVFGEENFLNMISLKAKNNAGASGGGEDKKLKKNVEYILVYCKNKNLNTLIPPNKKTNLMDIINYNRVNNIGFYYTRILKNEGEKRLTKVIKDGKGENIYIYEHTNFKFSTIDKVMKEEGLDENQAYLKYHEKIFMVTNAQSSIVKKVNDETNEIKKFISYEYTPKTGKDAYKLCTKYIWNKTLLVWLKDTTEKNNRCIIKNEKLGTLWDDISFGRIDLEGGISFKNGKKPISLIKRIIKMIANKDAIVLDFFAGSGTTGHSVLDLNKEDGGSRQFILCTNNEVNEEKQIEIETELKNKGLVEKSNEWKDEKEKRMREEGICTKITYPRLKNVINGYSKTTKSKSIDGLGGNLKYYKTEFVEKPSKINGRIKADVKRELSLKCEELLCIKENIFDKENIDKDFIKKLKNKNFNIYTNSFKVMGVYSKQINYDDLDKIKDLFKSYEGKEKLIYLFIDETEIDEIPEVIELKESGINIVPIPQKIMDIYDSLR